MNAHLIRCMMTTHNIRCNIGDGEIAMIRARHKRLLIRGQNAFLHHPSVVHGGHFPAAQRLLQMHRSTTANSVRGRCIVGIGSIRRFVSSAQTQQTARTRNQSCHQKTSFGRVHETCAQRWIPVLQQYVDMIDAQRQDLGHTAAIDGNVDGVIVAGRVGFRHVQRVRREKHLQNTRSINVECAPIVVLLQLELVAHVTIRRASTFGRYLAHAEDQVVSDVQCNAGLPEMPAGRNVNIRGGQR